MLAELSREKF